MFYNLHYAFQRWRHRSAAQRSSLSTLYQHTHISTNQLFYATRFLVVDCEMSGLNSRNAQLLSIGWVVIENARILNSSGKHFLIHADKGAGDSTKIHGLLDSSIAGANSPASVLMMLIKQMPQSVLVFHHARLDIQFLQQIAQQHFRCPLLFSYVDTMKIEQQRLALQGKTQGLRLHQCRERYGLPSTLQHNALADAQATAELLLAQATHINNDIQKVRLRDLSLSCC